jgi:hypothetical protein
MFHIKPETLNVPPDMSSISSTSTTNPLLENQQENSQKVFLHKYVGDTFLMKCKVCDVYVPNKQFEKHVKTKHHVKFICYKCSEVFQDSVSLRCHFKEYHLIYCNFCDRSYEKENKLRRHIKRVHLNGQDECMYSETTENVIVNKVDDQRDLSTTSFNEFGKTQVDEQRRVLYTTPLKDESGNAILKCNECESTFNCSIKFRSYTKEIRHYKWLCLDCCQREIYVPKRDSHCTLCPKTCLDKLGLANHFSAKHPGVEFPYTLPKIPTSNGFKVFIHESIPYKSEFPSQFSQFPSYLLKCKICDEIFYTH